MEVCLECFRSTTQREPVDSGSLRLQLQPRLFSHRCSDWTPTRATRPGGSSWRLQYPLYRAFPRVSTPALEKCPANQNYGFNDEDLADKWGYIQARTNHGERRQFDLEQHEWNAWVHENYRTWQSPTKYPRCYHMESCIPATMDCLEHPRGTSSRMACPICGHMPVSSQYEPWTPRHRKICAWSSYIALSSFQLRIRLVCNTFPARPLGPAGTFSIYRATKSPFICKNDPPMLWYTQWSLSSRISR